MIQKQNNGFLPSLDFIVLFIVFVLGISFTGILLPSSRSTISTEGQTNTMIPYVDSSSDKTLQIKDIKFDSQSPNLPPSSENETCEKTAQLQTQAETVNLNGPN